MRLRTTDKLIHPITCCATTGGGLAQASQVDVNGDPVHLRKKLSAMTSTGRGRGATYAESTKLQIIRAVLRQPGRTGKQIAESLGLDRSRVNSFLYGEGKRRFGLIEANWRWYPSRAHEPGVPCNRPKEPAYGDHRVVEQSESVCAILSRMSITNATLKIRTLSLTLVELAFGEDEYSALDERLQAELIIRKKTLELASNEVHVVRHGSSRWAWVIIVILGAWVLMLMSNQQPADNQNNLQQPGEAERVLPGQ
jgi:hypothetical protein